MNSVNNMFGPDPTKPLNDLLCSALIHGSANQHQHLEVTDALSGREAKLLKRKQANRAAAAKSKLKKKLETELVASRRKQLADENKELEQQIREMQARLQSVQEMNRGLKREFERLLSATTSVDSLNNAGQGWAHLQ